MESRPQASTLVESRESAQERGIHEFSNPHREWRRLFSEAWGTFLLVIAAAGAGVVGTLTGKVSLAMAAVAPGLTVMAVIYFMGTVSGAHLNPAVTIAFALRRNFPWARVPGYLLAQFIGGTLATLVLRAMFGAVGNLGATMPGDHISNTQAFGMEVLLSTGLVNTILGTASGARNIGTNGAIAIGGYIALAGLWAAPISGASMNPARSLAPDLVRGEFATTWIYVAGPLLGAIIAVGFEWILKGPATPEGTRTAQGGPGER
jgi:aquaporin Z